MSLQEIDLGTAPSNGTGDSARAAGQKINANFQFLDHKIDNVSTTPGSNGQRLRTVIDIVDNTQAPQSETEGNRYILDFTPGGVHADWDGASAGEVVEFINGSWVATTPEEGVIVYVDDLDVDYRFIDDGTSAWEVVSSAVAKPMPNVYFLKDYGVKADGIDFSTASISAGSPNLEVTGMSFTNDDVGKVVVLEGAGNSDYFFKSTIISVTDSENVVLNDNAIITISNKSGFYGTDDTTSIQSAINDVYTQGGGKLIASKGIHVIDGVLQNNVGVNTINYNSQLYIPFQSFEDRNRTTVILEASIKTSAQQGTALISVGERRASNNGSVFRTTIKGTGLDPSIICSRGTFEANSNVLSFNSASFECHGVNFQYVPYGFKAQMTVLNFRRGNTCYFSDLSMFPYHILLAETLYPDIIEVSGIIMPTRSCGVFTRIVACNIGGFTNGIVVGEHGYLEANHTLACVNSLNFGRVDHISYVKGHLAQWSVNYIYVSEISFFNITDFDIEWSDNNLWYDNQLTIKDPLNLGSGMVQYHIIKEGGVFDNSLFSKQGGVKIRSLPIGFETENDILVTGSTDAQKLDSLITVLQKAGLINFAASIPSLTYYRLDNDLLDQLTGFNGVGTNVSFGAGKGSSSPDFLKGRAVQFSGGSSYVTIPDDDIFSFVNTPWSVSFMVKFNSLSGNQVILNKRSASESEYQINLINGNLRLALFTGTSFLLSDTDGFVFATNTWYHVVFTDDGTNDQNKKIYVNKILQPMNYSIGGVYSGMANTDAPLYLGTQGTGLGSNSFNGSLQRLSFKSGELKQPQIDEIFETEFVNENDLV